MLPGRATRERRRTRTLQGNILPASSCCFAARFFGSLQMIPGGSTQPIDEKKEEKRGQDRRPPGFERDGLGAGVSDDEQDCRRPGKTSNQAQGAELNGRNARAGAGRRNGDSQTRQEPAGENHGGPVPVNAAYGQLLTRNAADHSRKPAAGAAPQGVKVKLIADRSPERSRDEDAGEIEPAQPGEDGRGYEDDFSFDRCCDKDPRVCEASGPFSRIYHADSPPTATGVRTAWVSNV